MTADEVRDALRRRAGVRSVSIPVRVVDHPRMIPPTLRTQKRKRMLREVVVSAEWMRAKMPRAWAALATHRLLQQATITITQLKED